MTQWESSPHVPFDVPVGVDSAARAVMEGITAQDYIGETQFFLDSGTTAEERHKNRTRYVHRGIEDQQWCVLRDYTGYPSVVCAITYQGGDNAASNYNYGEYTSRPIHFA